MTTTFLSWNLNRKSLQHLVASLSRERNVDVLILLECDIAVPDLLQSLNPPGARQIFHYAPNLAETPNETIKIFTLFSTEFLRPLHEENRLTVRHLKLPLRIDIILAALHFRSK